MNFIIFVLSKCRTKLLAANHLIIWERTKFDTELKSLKFLLEIMILVSPANNIGSDTEFVLRGRSFIYVMNNRGHRIDLCKTPCFNVGLHLVSVYIICCMYWIEKICSNQLTASEVNFSAFCDKMSETAAHFFTYFFFQDLCFEFRQCVTWLPWWYVPGEIYWLFKCICGFYRCSWWNHANLCSTSNWTYVHMT
jgi:hypothetical protein